MLRDGWIGVFLPAALATVAAVAGTGGPAPAGAPMHTTLFDFATSAQARAWRTVDDVVMGGVSRSTFEVHDDGTATFAGTVSLENNGGFASVRTVPRDYDIAGSTAVRLRVRGDGKVYRFRVRMDDGFDGIAWQAAFETTADTWIEIELPWTGFEASFRGRAVRDADPVDPARIRQVGFLIAEKQQGPFRLRIDWIRAVTPGD